ncbi:hypothetical protein SY85_15655 [Flavisolibacter tropicus]|uniref:Uncharacterized protein n=1 Tax=Flavisolibacter tropicus TaxID=1492898 RepID=A0A172TXL9_9BACT|nr:hypothetical protein SY85_15655 [Flavisolibacter tropicus]
MSGAKRRKERKEEGELRAMRKILNKEQGMMNIEGRKCSMLNNQHTMFNEERWNWELGIWNWGKE